MGFLLQALRAAEKTSSHTAAREFLERQTRAPSLRLRDFHESNTCVMWPRISIDCRIMGYKIHFAGNWPFIE